VIAHQHSHLTWQPLKEPQTAANVRQPLADVARENSQVGLLGGNPLRQRQQLLLSGDAQVQVTGNDDARHPLPPLVLCGQWKATIWLYCTHRQTPVAVDQRTANDAYC
jgi:hypothetical protein